MKKKILSMIIAVSCIMQSFGSVVYANEAVSADSKIEENLLNRMNKVGMDEELPVYIWLESVNKNEIEQELQELGYVSNNTEDNVQKKEGYQATKAKILYEKSEQILNEFVNEYFDDTEDASILVGVNVVKTDLTKEEINEFATIDDVKEISYCKDISPKCDSDIAQQQVRADWRNGTKSIIYNSGCGYTGDGVKVGILEYSRYDESAPQLASIDGVRLFTISKNGNIQRNASKSDHVTAVTSLIVGQGQDDYYSYEGVAPMATVYQLPIKASVDELFQGVMSLAIQGVSVINFSAQIDCVYGYSEIDRMLDELIYQLGIVFVTTAGNHGLGSGMIGSPGKGYNIITVGNANTKSNATTALNVSKFEVAKDSSYVEPSYLTNKPEIVAPGTNISCLMGNGSVYCASGTSFAAPLVTGVIAQMLEANPELEGNPVAIKAKLLLAANNGIMSSTRNTLLGTTWREASGAGMLNAVGAVLYGKDTNHRMVNYDITKSSELCDKVAQKCYFYKGDKVRAVLCYDKPNNSIVDSVSDNNNIDLKLVDNSTGTILAQSTSTCDNVEIIEYTITKTGYYNLVTSAKSFSREGIEDYNHELHCCVAWKR